MSADTRAALVDRLVNRAAFTRYLSSNLDACAMNVIETVLREERANTRAELRKLAVYCFMRYGHDAYLYNSLADLAGMPIVLTKCQGCGAETTGVNHVCFREAPANG